MPGKVEKVTHLQASYPSVYAAKTLNTIWEVKDDRRKQEITNTLVIVGAEARDQLGCRNSALNNLIAKVERENEKLTHFSGLLPFFGFSPRI